MVPFSAFRNLGRVILVCTELQIPNTGVPLGSIMTLSADMNLGIEFRLLTESLFSYTEVHTCNKSVTTWQYKVNLIGTHARRLGKLQWLGRNTESL